MTQEIRSSDNLVDAWWEALIAHVPGVQGGAVVVRGTRTPVRTIIARLREYDGDLVAVRSALPHLSEQEIRAAHAYYERHPDEIRADEQRRARAFDALVNNAAS